MWKEAVLHERRGQTNDAASKTAACQARVMRLPRAARVRNLTGEPVSTTGRPPARPDRLKEQLLMAMAGKAPHRVHNPKPHRSMRESARRRRVNVPSICSERLVLLCNAAASGRNAGY